MKLKYFFLVLSIISLVLITNISHATNFQVSYSQPMWHLWEKNDIGHYIDVKIEKLGNHNFKFTIEPNQTLLKTARDVMFGKIKIMNSKGKISVPDDLKKKFKHIKHWENLKYLDKYPIHLYKCKYKDPPEEDICDWIEVPLSIKQINLLLKNPSFRIDLKSLGLDPGDRYKLKIGFHSITYTYTNSYYNGISGRTHLYYYNSTDGTYSSDLFGTTFDYFPDNAKAGDMLYFVDWYHPGQYESISFYIGTPRNGDVECVWEYHSEDGTWKEIPYLVDDTDCFSKSGEHRVFFNMDEINDWGPTQIADSQANCWAIRARLTSVSGMTEGGAQSSTVPRFPRRYIVVTGGNTSDPITLADIYDWDISHNNIILDTTISSSPEILDIHSQIRPPGVPTRLIIQATARAGATVNITGWDANYTLISEVVDISSGEAWTKHSFKYIKDNGINVTGLTPGDSFKILEPKMGLIEFRDPNLYILHGGVIVGDGTTPTVFTEKRKQIYASRHMATSEQVFVTSNNANLTFGEVMSETDKSSRYGISFYSSYYYPRFKPNYIYSSTITYVSGITEGGTTYGKGNFRIYPMERIWNSIINGGAFLTYSGLSDPSQSELYNVFQFINNFDNTNCGKMDRIYIFHSGRILYLWRDDYVSNFSNIWATVTSYAGYMGTTNPITKDSYWDDCEIKKPDGSSGWIFYWVKTGSTGKVYRRYSVDITIKDENGNPVSDATVEIYDTDNNLVYSGTTNSAGQIPTQKIIYAYYTSNNGASGYGIEVKKSPHTIKVYKSGYVPVVISNISIDEKKNIQIELHGKRDLYPINLAMISGTEYKPGEDVYLAVQVTDAYGNPVSGATCTFDVYYPDMTLWLDDIGTTYLGNGIYYNNSYTAPSTYGVYTYIANCTYGSSSVTVSKTFHVAEWTGDISEIFNKINNDIIPRLSEINTTVHENQQYLSEINQTTHQTLEKWGSQTAQSLYNLESQTKAIAQYINETRWGSYAFSDVMDKWGTYSASDIYSVSDQARVIADYINETRWNTYLASDLYSISNQARTIADYINQTRWDSYTASDLYTISSQIKVLSEEINQTTSDNYILLTQVQSDVTYLYNRENCSNYVTETGTKCWYLDLINDTLSSLDVDVNESSIAEAVWNHTTRTLTDYPEPIAVVSFDLSKEGLINRTIYDVSIQHIVGDVEPTSDSSFATYRYKKYIFDIGDVPSNMTRAFLTFWLKKTGNPTGYLNITLNDNLIYSIDVTTIDTSYDKYVIEFDPSSITSKYIEVKFIGDDSWLPSKTVYIGADDLPSIHSLESSDNTTWEASDNEYIIALTIEYYQKSIADQFNEESITIFKNQPKPICLGQAVIGSFEFFDYQGNELEVTTTPSCSLAEILPNGSIVNVPNVNVNVAKTCKNKLKVWINETYTSQLDYSKIYRLQCININVTTTGGNNVVLSDQGMLFRTLSELECSAGINYLSDINDSSTQIYSIVQDLIDMHNCVYEPETKICQLLNEINITTHSVLSNQLAYFPVWNASIYYWNNTYFVNWDGEIMNLSSNWDTLWSFWGCDEDNNMVCNLLMDINSSIEHPNPMAGGWSPTSFEIYMETEPKEEENLNGIDIDYDKSFVTSPDEYYVAPITVTNNYNYTVSVKFTPVSSNLMIEPSYPIYIRPGSRVKVNLYLPIKNEGEYTYVVNAKIVYLTETEERNIEIFGKVTKFYYLYVVYYAIQSNLEITIGILILITIYILYNYLKPYRRVRR